MDKNEPIWKSGPPPALQSQEPHALFNQRDINIHVRINDTPFSYASVDFPRTPALCVLRVGRQEEGGGECREEDRVLGGSTRALQYVTVANFRGQLPATSNSGRSDPRKWKGQIVTNSVTNYEWSRWFSITLGTLSAWKTLMSCYFLLSVIIKM